MQKIRANLGNGERPFAQERQSEALRDENRFYETHDCRTARLIYQIIVWLDAFRRIDSKRNGDTASQKD